MEAKMEKLTIGDKTNVSHSFAPKKAAGKSGTPCEVICNAVKIDITKNVPLYKYDIHTEVVFPARDGKGDDKLKSLTKGNKQDSQQVRRRELAVSAYKKVLDSFPTFFKKPLFYDRQAVLFAVNKLAIGDNEKVFEIPATGIYPDQEAKCIRFTIKQVDDSFQVTTDQKSIVSASKPGASEADKTLLEALNIVLSNSSYTDTDLLITYGNNVSYLLYPEKTVFDNSREVAQSRVPAILPNLSACKYTGVGVSKSVKALEGDGKPTLYAFTDVKKTPFYQDGCRFLDLLSDVCKDANLSRRLAEGIAPHDPIAVQLLRSVKGLGVRTLYDKKGADGKLIEIHGFGPKASSKESEFFHEADKKTYTISSYYKNVLKYDNGRGLKYPNMFTVYDRYNKKIRYPAEVLVIAENQRVPTAHLTPIEQGALVKAAATLPQKRLEQTDFMKNACKINSKNTDVASCGLHLSDTFTKVPARVLTAPIIKFGGNKTVNVQGNVKWDSGAASKFIDPKSLSNWHLIAIRSNDADQFGRNLVKRAQELGMKVAAPTFKDMSNASLADIEAHFLAAKNAKVQMLFFVINQNINLHNNIKLFELKCDVLTQEVKAQTATKTTQGQRQTMDNIICKTNQKLGGLNFELLTRDGKNSVTSAPHRLIFGFEKSHAAPHSDQPSVLGWSANIGVQPAAFMGDYRYYNSKDDEAFLEFLKAVVPQCCKEVRKNRNATPTDMVFYFNGISEGQFAEVRDHYVTAILDGLKTLSATYNPTVTILVVSKTHNERFYKTNIPGSAKAPEQNISPGTVIDRTVVSAAITEFFLNAHSAIQGTAATPKYSLIYTSANFTSDQIQELTYHLTFLHEIVSSATALPVPLVVADRYAKRGHNNQLTDSLSGARSVASGDSDSPDVRQLNDTLSYEGKSLSLTRYNA